MDQQSIHPEVLHQWTEEVLHLHALWQLGPPQNRNPNPPSRPNKRRNAAKPPTSDNPPTKTAAAEEFEWPTVPAACSKPPPASWNDFAPPPAPRAFVQVSAEEQARANAAKAQRNGMKASADFFSKDDGSEEDSDGDDDMGDDDEGKNGSFSFFLQLFDKDAELREYYKKNYESGEFSCLVCGGTDMKKRKRYGDGVALVQHAKSVSKRIQKHRAFARAVCHALGWDIDRLPAIMPPTNEERVHKEGHIDEKEKKVDQLDSFTELSDVDKLEWPSALTQRPNPLSTTQRDLTSAPLVVAHHLASAGEQPHADATQQNGLKVAPNSSSEKDGLDDNIDEDAISLEERVYQEGPTNAKENKEGQMYSTEIKEVIEVLDINEVEQKVVPTTNNKIISSHSLQPETSTAFKKKKRKRKKKVLKCLLSDNLLGSHDPPPATMGADHADATQQNGLKFAPNSSSEKDGLDDNMDEDAISLEERVYQEGPTNAKENKEGQMYSTGIKEVIEVLDINEVEQKGVPTTNNKIISSHSLQPETSTAFKKKKRKRKKKVLKCLLSDNLLGSHDPPPAAMGGDQVESPTAPAVDSKSPLMLMPNATEEQVCMDAAKAQQNGLKACEDFFSKKEGSLNNSDGNDYMDMVGEGNKHFDFFLELFKKDGDLMEYYKKNHGRGGFSCLVCSGTGMKKSKRYSDVMSLMQHTTAVTKRLMEHQAFSRAIFQVLSWDAGKLSSPTTMETLGHSMFMSVVNAEEKDHIDKSEDIQKEISESCSHEDVAGSSENMTTD